MQIELHEIIHRWLEEDGSGGRAVDPEMLTLGCTGHRHRSVTRYLAEMGLNGGELRGELRGDQRMPQSSFLLVSGNVRGARYPGRTASSARTERLMSLHGRHPRVLAIVKMTTAVAAV